MHLLARYPGYIIDGGSFRHIPWFADYSGSGEGGGEQYVGNTKKCMGAKRGQYVDNTQEISKNERFANFNFFFTVRTPYFLKMIMCI